MRPDARRAGDHTTLSRATPAAHTHGDRSHALPTAPYSVVWSAGHAYVREERGGPTRWTGVDDRGRPCFLSDAELHRRGWSYQR